MNKPDSTVVRETKLIALWSLIFSALMQAVFLVAGKWDYTVLFGNLLGLFICIGNFFLMGITVSKAVKKEEKDAKLEIKASQSLRTVLIFAFLALGALLSCFNVVACVIPVFFSRIAILLRPLWDKELKCKREETEDE